MGTVHTKICIVMFSYISTNISHMRPKFWRLALMQHKETILKITNSKSIIKPGTLHLKPTDYQHYQSQESRFTVHHNKKISVTGMFCKIQPYLAYFFFFLAESSRFSENSLEEVFFLGVPPCHWIFFNQSPAFIFPAACDGDTLGEVFLDDGIEISSEASWNGTQLLKPKTSRTPNTNKELL